MIETLMDSAKDVGMGSEAEVITAGKVSELASTKQNTSAINLLERLGESGRKLVLTRDAFGFDVHSRFKALPVAGRASLGISPRKTEVDCGDVAEVFEVQHSFDANKRAH